MSLNYNDSLHFQQKKECNLVKDPAYKLLESMNQNKPAILIHNNIKWVGQEYY